MHSPFPAPSVTENQRAGNRRDRADQRRKGWGCHRPRWSVRDQPGTGLAFHLLITYVGYENLETQVTSLDKPITLKLRAKEVELKGVEVTGSRISEKQKQAPLTVESMDIIAIKDCPQPSFYQALGTLKGLT